jgi:hypothetical protein
MRIVSVRAYALTRFGLEVGYPSVTGLINIDISSANDAIINIVSQQELALHTYHRIGNIIQ